MLIGLLSMRAAPGASGFEHDLADVLALQDPAVGCRCFGEGVGRVDARLDLVLLPEREDRLEFFAQDSHLPPEVADLVMTLLMKDPTQRMGSAREVVQAIQRITNGAAKGHASGRRYPMSATAAIAMTMPPLMRRYAL